MEAGRRFIKLESLKRDIKLELKDSMRCRRDRFQSLSDPLGYVFADPPWLAEHLAWTVDDEKDEINDLICRIKNGVCKMEYGFHKGKIKRKQNKFVEECTKDIQVCTKELSGMITADPRLCDLLGRDSLEVIVSLLRHEHEHSEKLQTHAAIILRSVVTFSRNKNEVGVVIKNITPVVFHLIRSPDFWVQVEALWLLRNLIYKISKSSIEQALSPIISIILKNSNDNKVLQAAFEVLKAVCEAHPKLSCEQLKLVVQALMKLIESNSSRQIFAGCLGLALLCDGREEMVVEEKDFETLICRLVLFMNSADCGEIIHGLICLGSIVRWGDDDAIQAIIQDEGEEGLVHSLSMLLEEGNMYMVKHVCWIISNITARKFFNYYMEDVHDAFCGLLLKLVKVVQTCTVPDVVKEALWAVSNAMCCTLGDFWWSTLDTYWVRRLIPFLSDKLLVMVFLEGMVNIGMADYFWKGLDEPDHSSKFNHVFKDRSSELNHVFKNIWFDTEMLHVEFYFRKDREPRRFVYYDSLTKVWNSVQAGRPESSILLGSPEFYLPDSSPHPKIQ
ncbi:hypothetical protein POM88_038585 [Heracleum sosnowskyi]|uniref:Uncharacterized protein n=1 Tax=Heracleum sosnowskyi TaxID=360622 RepID=A0AAD8H9K1_9APIA|nr:hypothetical protein POM88_038585 [Heracleum sosnowskyi]